MASAVVRDSPDHAAFLPVRTVVGSVGLQPSWPEPTAVTACAAVTEREGAIGSVSSPKRAAEYAFVNGLCEFVRQ